MALIKCPECNKEISDTVESCIHCGYKITKLEVYNKSKEEKIETKGKGCLILIIVTIIIF